MTQQLSEDEIEYKKRWVFEQIIKINEKDKELEDERKLIEIQKGMLERQKRRNLLLSKQLENQKNLFDQQWQIMENGFHQLALDKERFEREKLVYRDTVYREARRGMNYSENVKLFFKGVDDTTSLKKRYKELLKIFHPDNTHGDSQLIQAIMSEYETQRRFFLGT
ncbi:MAG: hypothetical protein HFJ03_00895 [Lachnospira sp.]|nr:hypothetical protein [Lachnospira sp.]